MSDAESPLPAGASIPGTETPHPGLTDQEWADLRSLGDDLAGVEISPWQPRCIANAFARDDNDPGPRFTLTMQIWINLDRVKSSVLEWKTPDNLDDLERALRAFYYGGPAELKIEEWAQLAVEMVDACKRGFSAALGMRPKENGPDGDPDGFGSWAPLLACLVVQVGLDPAVALSMPVEKAHILIASMRRNQGWVESGMPYNLRDLEEETNG